MSLASIALVPEIGRRYWRGSAPVVHFHLGSGLEIFRSENSKDSHYFQK